MDMGSGYQNGNSNMNHNGGGMFNI